MSAWPFPRFARNFGVVFATAMAFSSLVVADTREARAESFVDAREAALTGHADAAARLRAVATDVSLDAVTRRDAWHLLARLLDHAEPPQPAEAIVAWREALTLGLSKEAPSALLDALRFGLANATVEGGCPPERDDEVLALFLAVERDVWSPLRVDAAWARARFLDQLGREKDARKVYESIVDRWPDAPVVRAVKVRIAALDVAAGNLDKAQAALAEIRRWVPNSIAAEQAGILLASAGAGTAGGGGGTSETRVSLKDIEWMLDERRYPQADAALEPWLTPEPGPDAPREVRLQWLKALELKLESDWENFRLDDALALHQKLKAHKRPGLSTEKLIRLHAYDGEFDKALDLLKDKFARKKTPAYYEALGDLYFEFGKFQEAYDAYVKAWGKKSKVEEQSDRMTWCLLRTGKSAAARNAWATAGKTRGFNKNMFARYWYARSLELAGKGEDAKPIFEGLVEDAPLEYYGHQAWSRLQDMAGTAPAGVNPPPPQAISTAHPLPPMDVTPTVSWSEASLTPDWSMAPRPAPLADLDAATASFATAWGETSQEARRAAELVHLGDVTGATAELRVIDMDLRALRNSGGVSARARSDLLDNRSSPKARGGAPIRENGRKTTAQATAFKAKASDLRKDLRALQVRFADPYAIRRATVDKDGATLTPELLDGDAGKGFYPLAYPDVVEPLARQFGVPPYFVYAVMTVESGFHSGAVSVANAYGLVQVIPKTGYNLALELGYLDFSPELLLEPPVSIYFGGYYLSRLLSRFRGQEPLAAAAYNAGPHRVASWLMARGKIPLDMFIEDIPYDQARGYTKTVLEHIANYRRVYHGEAHLYVRNTIRTDQGDGPNY